MPRGGKGATYLLAGAIHASVSSACAPRRGGCRGASLIRNTPSRRTLQKLSLVGTYGGPRGVGVSYERVPL